MNRCVICRGRIWPWQRRGWLVTLTGVERWHGKCWRRTDA